MILAASQIAADCGNYCKLFACSICCQAVVRVGMVGVGGRPISFVGGMYSSSFFASSSLVASSVAAVMSSSQLSLTLLVHTVLSSAKSWLMFLIWAGYSSG